MKVIKPSFETFEDLTDPAFAVMVMRKLEVIGRTCYKSENCITEESGRKFVRKLIEHGHEAMLEHVSISVKFTVDRGVSHELVRHRMASFAQESTRYCNYSNEKFGSETTVIKPCFYQEYSEEYDLWKAAMENAEYKYFQLLNAGSTPQEARSVLPNSLKTELIITANEVEWQHIIDLRFSGVTGAPHPQMKEAMSKIVENLYFESEGRLYYDPKVFGGMKNE